MACVHLTWGGYLCFATSFSSCAHIPKLEKCLVRPLGDHTHDFGGGLEFSYIIVLMVLYGPCCKSDSDHHCADSIYHHHYMELLHPFQNEKQEQDEEPLLVYFVILSARHFWHFPLTPGTSGTSSSPPALLTLTPHPPLLPSPLPSL